VPFSDLALLDLPLPRCGSQEPVALGDHGFVWLEDAVITE
jgi:hypothetical protein